METLHEYRPVLDLKTKEVFLKSFKSAIDKIDKKKFMGSLLLELDRLDQESKSVFILRFQEDLKINEISKILSLPQGTVKSKLFYTIKKVAPKLYKLRASRSLCAKIIAEAPYVPGDIITNSSPPDLITTSYLRTILFNCLANCLNTKSPNW